MNKSKKDDVRNGSLDSEHRFDLAVCQVGQPLEVLAPDGQTDVPGPDLTDLNIACIGLSPCPILGKRQRPDIGGVLPALAELLAPEIVGTWEIPLDVVSLKAPRGVPGRHCQVGVVMVRGRVIVAI